jgi:hypothetical protein
VDLWIELLHAAGREPLAALPFTLAVDLEGDQWTFFKFPLADLDALFGIEVFELNIWRSLVKHVGDQLSLGRPSIVEVDAFYLPDTAGTSYRAEHVKTSIAVQALDDGARRLGYFHNAAYYELGGDDFSGVFRLDGRLAGPEYLPPYVEVAKLGARPALEGRALLAASIDRLRDHLARRPSVNPFRRYAAAFDKDVQWLAGEPLTTFHGYAFATLRQCGAAFDLAGAYLRWLGRQGEAGLENAAAACDRIAGAAKGLQFATARAVHTRRRADSLPALETMAAAWDDVMDVLTRRFGA